jgi:hypothetical protein
MENDDIASQIPYFILLHPNSMENKDFSMEILGTAEVVTSDLIPVYQPW